MKGNEMDKKINQLVEKLSDALIEAYANSGNRHYFKAATEMGAVQAQVWMAQKLPATAQGEK
jgi:predicted transcriptional regulator